MLTMLDVNNFKVDTNKEILKELADSSGSYEDTLAWIIKYCNLSSTNERMVFSRYPDAYKRRLVRRYA